jgi:RHS repeat-associated protein
VTTYTYDAENQLIRVDRPGLVAEYRYDALGRRIEKNVNGVSTRYIYDNEDIVAEADATNTAQAFYLHGPGIDEPLSMGRFGAGGGTFTYHADGLGSISSVTSSTGAVTRSYTYDSFGRIVTQTGTLVNPYTYTGRELDPESSLYYYRARYYDPTIGRFSREDPLFSGKPFPTTNPEISHMYVYAVNNPATLTDPSGLGPCEDVTFPCFRATRDRSLQCQRNIFEFAVACVTGCVPLCLATAAGGTAGLTACRAIATAENLQCVQQYTRCKKDRCEEVLPF